jgi:hypothetical protein
MFISRFRRGFLERIDEHIAFFVVCWFSISPLVIFQALLSARDDHQIQNNNDYPTATEVVTPLLIILGWITIASAFLSWNYRTAFQVSICISFSFSFFLFRVGAEGKYPTRFSRITCNSYNINTVINL